MTRNQWVKLGIFLTFIVTLGGFLVAGPTQAQRNTPQSPALTTSTLGTAFTYQGRLTDGGSPANGAYDFQFTLYDAASGGSAVGSTIDEGDVTVTDGLFTVELDFGSVFDGAAVWLDIAVRPGSSTGAYTALSPRQALTAAPYALSLQPGATIQGDAGYSALSVINTATSGPGLGVLGRTYSPDGNGVSGLAEAASGASIGTYGRSSGSSGYGVYGWADSATGLNYGVYGKSSSTSGTGVYGLADAASGSTYGVYGRSDSPDGQGVHGVASAVSGNAYGVKGESWSTTGRGVYGVANAASGTNYGVYGVTNSPAGYAGYFSGNVHVNGTLSKSAGSFRIDHPLDPANQYLSHSFVESPDMMNIYNGNVILDAAGAAWVEMPDWFQALNQEFRYQLTPIGAPGPDLYIAQEIQDNRFQIAGGAPGMKVSWQVTGIRHDPYAEQNRIPVEEIKPPNERGTYLYPQGYGQPESMGLDYQRNAERDAEVNDEQ